MAIMDLSINQETMGVQNRFGNQVFKLNNFDETDVKGNNNLYNSRKTDTDNESGSLFRDGYSSENLQVDPSLFSYSSFKKAMDLRTHNRSDDENKRTIFDDADYFAKNFFYKLLPITFEQVDETIIHTEHNYSLFSLNSESEAEEDCSRTMDYSQIKEKNYKRRRTKFKEGSDDEEWGGNEDANDSNQNIENQKEPSPPEPEPVPENTILPLDLSTAPPVQEQKTDPSQHCHLKDSGGKEENVPSKLKCIQVTITRPDEKENYQPCDMFLNDIARLVPRLINNDCFEIDILDRTGDRHEDFRKHRLYYIIAESTWRLFQSTRERVILTNDHTLGPPLKKMENDERPTFLVFDQFSLAKCLAEYCEEIGGCFEYTCVEEEKEESVKNTKMIELVTKTIEMDEKNEPVVEKNEEETQRTRTDTEEIQMSELNLKSKIVAEEITVNTKANENDENLSLDKDAEAVELSSKEKKGEIKTEMEFEKFNEKAEEKEEEDTKTEEINAETEKIESETNEIRLDADNRLALEDKGSIINTKDSSLNLHPEKRIIRRRGKRQRKKTEINAREGKKNLAKAENRKSKKIIAEEMETFETEKADTTVSNNITKITSVDAVNSYIKTVDTKETKDIKMQPNIKGVYLFETGNTKVIEMSLENKKTIKEDSKETKSDEIKAEILVGETKADEVIAESVSEVRSERKIRKRKLIKKNKRLKNAVETFAEETETSATRVRETNIHEDAKEIKANEGGKTDAGEMKKIKRIRKSRKEIEVKKKDIKSPKEKSKSVDDARESEKVEIKNKRKGSEEEKAGNPPSKKIRKKNKLKNNSSGTVPQIKTRSKSTSESETSQKPNKEIEKPKNTEKGFQSGAGRSKGSAERGRTRSRKGTREKKQNGTGLRGRKRKLEEEHKMEKKMEERCLRSRERKGKIENVGASGKRKKK